MHDEECMARRLVVVHHHVITLILLHVISSAGGHHIVAPPKTARPELLLRICRDTVAQNPEAYKRSYDAAIESMSGVMGREGFAKVEMGESPDRIYVLAQCMKDLEPANCTQCFKAIHTMMSNCFPATGGRIVYWGCYIRVDNYSFFNIDMEPGDTRLMKCSEVKTGGQGFANLGQKKLWELVKKVPEKEYDVVYKRKENVLFVGVAVCWRSLDKKGCQSCLADARHRCAECLSTHSTECRLLNSGCALRYADYDFTNNPQKHLLREILSLYTSYVLGGLAVSTFIAAVGIYLSRINYKRKASQRTKNTNGNGVKRVQIKFKLSEKGLNCMEFNYSTLEKSTECFADSHRLGQGGYGEVFKGTLPDGREIAIKRLFATSGNSQSEEICNEIDIISRAQHRNLVRFLGCCFTNANNFLVYEYLVNKSLDRILFDSEKKKDLDWNTRWQIILGTAEGLEYLHKGCQLRIIHRDIKASNVLLDAKWRPKIADFGLARFSSCGQNISSATIAGTFGYLAPEYLAQGRLTEKVDVYSFGVLLLEIVSGVRNNKLWSDSTFETLVTYVWKKFQTDTVSEIIAKELEVHENYIEKDVKRVVQVGLLCTQESPDLRPNMTMVIGMLKQDRNSELPLPTQPPFIDEHLEFSSSLSSFRWQPSLGLKL